MINEDNRPDSCTSLAFHHLGIPQDVIEASQALRPLHTIPFPLWIEVLERAAFNQLEPYEWRGTLRDFIQQHPTGKYFTIIEVTDEEDVTKRRTHAVAVVSGAAYNVSNTGRPIYKVWKLK